MDNKVVAESKTEEKEVMVKVVANLINQRNEQGLLEYKSIEGLRSTPTPILRKPSMDFAIISGNRP